MTIPKIKENKLTKSLRQNRIVFAALFGSRANNTARVNSDYDLLVEFDPSISIPLSRFIKIKNNLRRAVDSEVDIITIYGLGQGKFKQEVLNNIRVLYDERKK